MALAVPPDVAVGREPWAAPALISVVLCTTGRRAALWDALDELVGLDDPAFEVVVVENAATPTLPPDRLRALGVRHVVERRVGLDVARNRGALEARGDLIAYVDDDCLVGRAWLAGLRLAFEDPGVALVTGRVVPASVGRVSEYAFERTCPWDRGVEPIRFRFSDQREWFPASGHHLGTGCNMAFRRSTLEAIGGFDEALDMGTLVAGGGDMDAFVRSLDAGFVAAYEPTAVVAHRHRTTLHDLRWQLWGYGVAQGAMMAKWAVTRRGVRRQVLAFWVFRLRSLFRASRSALLHRSDLPRSVPLVEAVGMAVGPFAYLPSRVQSWLRRRRA